MVFLMFCGIHLFSCFTSVFFGIPMQTFFGIQQASNQKKTWNRMKPFQEPSICGISFFLWYSLVFLVYFNVLRYSDANFLWYSDKCLTKEILGPNETVARTKYMWYYLFLGLLQCSSVF